MEPVILYTSCNSLVAAAPAVVIKKICGALGIALKETVTMTPSWFEKRGVATTVELLQAVWWRQTASRTRNERWTVGRCPATDYRVLATSGCSSWPLAKNEASRSPVRFRGSRIHRRREEIAREGWFGAGGCYTSIVDEWRIDVRSNQELTSSFEWRRGGIVLEDDINTVSHRAKQNYVKMIRGSINVASVCCDCITISAIATLMNKNSNTLSWEQ